MTEFNEFQSLRLDRNCADHGLQDDLGSAFDALRAISSTLLELEHADEDVREMLRCSKREAEQAQCSWREYEGRPRSAE